MSNPFSGPFAGAPGIGGNPLEDERNAISCCPKCRSTNFRAWSNQWGNFRKCLEAGCGEEWSGTSVAVAQQMFSEPLLPDGTVAPDADLPPVQYTGAGFRDPSKTYGDDDW